MLADVALAVQLQELDRRISELRQEIAALPRHLAQIEKVLEIHTRKLEADRAALLANQRERKRLEQDIQEQEQRISRLKDQMMGSKITNEQYAAFKKEIDFSEGEIRKHEDRILDLMGEAEVLEQNVQKAEAALNRERAQVEAEKQQVRQRTAADQHSLAEAESQRQQAVAAMAPAVYEAYERIRKKRKGVAVAEAVDGRCSACHLALRLQFFQDVRRGEQVMYCESCGRILYYHPPAEADELAASETQPLETTP